MGWAKNLVQAAPNVNHMQAAAIALLAYAVMLLPGRVETGAGKIISQDRLPAFPEAEGFGMYASGGRGGNVRIVTNLNDDGPGSLRESIQAEEPRTIVFEVSGTIDLESALRIRNGNVTIAGQSAPGDGVCLRNFPLIIDADNVIIRYMRFRLGDKMRQQADAMTGIGHRDIIIDHCSMSWATDECASFYDNVNFTLQWSFISESLNHSVHAKGDHGYGGIWGGIGASFHHNLIAHHNSRLPRFCGARYHKQPEKEIVDFRNNVIYNWMSNSSYGGESGRHNLVNNYYKSGPATPTGKKDRIVEPYRPYGKFYVRGNHVAGFPDVTANNGNGMAGPHIDPIKVSQPFEVASIALQSAEEAYDRVLKFGGASLHRDAVDARIAEEVRTGTATLGMSSNGIIDSQEDAGGWPRLRSAKAPADTDRDGIPDDWEGIMKLDINDPADAGTRSPGINYTNLEIYLNSLVRDQWK